jgi:hypothetical protein
MTLIELMKRDCLRVNNGDRWLTVDEDGVFSVMHKPYRSHTAKIVIETDLEAKAVAELAKGSS